MVLDLMVFILSRWFCALLMISRKFRHLGLRNVSLDVGVLVLCFLCFVPCYAIWLTQQYNTTKTSLCQMDLEMLKHCKSAGFVLQRLWALSEPLRLGENSKVF